MAGATRRLAEKQPESFEFSKENLEKAKAHIAKYPKGRQASAVMPLLDLAQRQNDNWVCEPAIRAIAEMLEMPYIRVLEVATFYTMYNLGPIGRHHIQVCTTTPCWLRGSGDVVSACKKHLGVGLGETTRDGLFTISEAECLGACVNAPMMQIGDDYYEDLDADSTVKILETLARGETPKPGPQIDRHTSEPLGGPTTLKSVPKSAGTKPAAAKPAPAAEKAPAEKTATAKAPAKKAAAPKTGAPKTATARKPAAKTAKTTKPKEDKNAG